MAETEQITVAEVSEGRGGAGDPGMEVSLPVVELLTGRGFVTGKSGSGKSNSASVIAEKLLDNGFGLLIVDIDGEYYGLKEEYEILHAGADEECDIQVTEDHAEKLASLALEQNVPIILDVSSFLDEAEAESVLTAVARHLFAKAKKQKQPFLLLVEEVHEYIPEGGSVGECGKMLIKIGKRGRKHGLGIVGISQRPADVKKDFITQCDWLVWHRLTWNNDTKVVKRILDSEYAEAVESLDDGEGFLVTDWAEQVRRVQFQRKRTFDAGATPGLDDVERPDLKSVSDNLVSELETISESQQQREDRIAELREELDEKNSRIAELETELQDARDLSRMADQFVDALVHQVEGSNPGRTEQDRLRERRRRNRDAAGANDQREATSIDESGEDDDSPAAAEDDDVAEAFTALAATEDSSNDDDGGARSETQQTTESDHTANGEFSATDVLEKLAAVGRSAADATATDGGAAIDGNSGENAIIDGDAAAPPEFRNGIGDSSDAREDDIIDGEDGDGPGGSDSDSSDGSTGDGPHDGEVDEVPTAARVLESEIADMETKTRKMLAFYVKCGPETPLNAHVAAGGDGDRTRAYAHNRRLRTRGLVEHVGQGRYANRIRDLLREELDGGVDEEEVEALGTDIEAALDDVDVDRAPEV